MTIIIDKNDRGSRALAHFRKNQETLVPKRAPEIWMELTFKNRNKKLRRGLTSVTQETTKPVSESRTLIFSRKIKFCARSA